MPKRKQPPERSSSVAPSGPPINPFPKPQPENALTVPEVPDSEDDDDLEEFVKNHGRLP